MNFKVINFANIEEIAHFLQNTLPFNHNFIIARHIPAHQREWFNNTVEAYMEDGFGYLSLFKIEFSKDKKVFRKIRI